MLKSLSVRNLAVLSGGDVELGAGLNVLTGETGAGKSLLVDSLALLTGARAASELVREGAEVLVVAGVFDLEPAVGERLRAAGLEAGEGELVVRREIGREGRNRVFVNDQPATARLLQELAPHLLLIHGQREELGLADPELQRAWLDRLGGAEAVALLAEVGELYGAHRDLTGRLARLTGDERLRRERLDLLRFQAREIDEARLVAGEEQELRRERDALRHAEAIVAALSAAQQLLSEGESPVGDQLAACRQELGRIEAWEPAAAEADGELAEAAARVDEAGRLVARRLASFEVEPGRLDEVEGRLALLERLFRKYDGGSAEILERRQAIDGELIELDGGEARREELEVACGAALEAYRQSALALSKARRAWAARLTDRLGAELPELALPQARIEVRIARTRRSESPLVVEGEPVEFGPSGFDRVELEFAPNPGEATLPLSRIASGGELARVALALQLATRGGESAGGPSLVFDEIDAGLGGAEGAAVGRKLRRLGRRRQVLVVTHLAQVASHGDRHYRVSKRERAGRTYATVEALERNERVEEIARMLSADRITPTSRRHAAELLAAAAGERGE